jgi:hypothetical protein
MNNKPLPYVTAAFLCEKILQEANGTISAIRIADKIGYTISGMPPGFSPTTQISGLLLLKSGPVIGDHLIKVVVEYPDGKRQDAFRQSVNFKGQDHGQAVIMNIALGIGTDGLYWFDVLFDDEVLTRIPITLTHEQQQAVKPSDPT